MILKNAAVFGADFKGIKTDLKISGEIISEFGSFLNDENIIDCTDKLLLPGFIDIHIHGTDGADISGGTDSLKIVSQTLARCGVTSFCPTSMTLSHNEMLKTAKSVGEYMGKESGAYIHGLNTEGPYISKIKKGSQNEEYIRKADINEFLEINSLCPVKIVCVAPECENAITFSNTVSEFTAVSVGHTNADYETASCAFENGFSHATHLFNAMTGLSSRESGVVGAVFDHNEITAELICDGFHIAPPTLRTAFRLLGKDRSVIISDCMQAANMPDGEYTLGGKTVYVKNKKAVLDDGSIAAGTDNVFSEFKKVLSYGIDFEQTLRSCSINPARVIGADKITGSIEKGKLADIIITDKDFNIQTVIIKGRIYR